MSIKKCVACNKYLGWVFKGMCNLNQKWGTFLRMVTYLEGEDD